MANVKQFDRLIGLAERKLEAVRNGEMWPLTGAERRQVLAALAGGSYKVVRGKSPSRAERKLETLSKSIEARLSAELSALQTQRQKLITQAAADKAAKKAKSWWR